MEMMASQQKRNQRGEEEVEEEDDCTRLWWPHAFKLWERRIWAAALNTEEQQCLVGGGGREAQLPFIGLEWKMFLIKEWNWGF